MADKRLSVGVDARGVDDFMKNYSQKSQEVMRNMIKEARSYTTSANEVNRSLDDQIKKRKEIIRLQSEENKADVQAAFLRGESTPKEKARRMAEIQFESREANKIVNEIKALRDDVVRSSKQEIQKDREGTERRIQADRSINRLGVSGDEIESLKRTYQQKQLQDIKDEELGQRGYDPRNLMMMPSNVIGTKSAVDLMSNASMGAGGMMRGMAGGVIGAMLAFTVGRVLSEFGEATKNVESSAIPYSILTGQSVKGLGGTVKGLNNRNISRYGMAPSDYFRMWGSLSTGAKTTNFGEDALNLMHIAGGTTLGEGDVSGLVNLRRYGGNTVSPLVSTMEKFLMRTEGNTAALQELTSTFSGQAQNIISRTGSVNTQDLMSSILGFSGQTGLTGTALQGAFGQFQQGMQQSGNPIFRDMQMRAARQVAGRGASFQDLRKIIADPSSPLYKQYTKNYMNMIRTMTGGGDMFEMALEGAGVAANPVMAGRVANYTGDDLEKGLHEELKKKSVWYGEKKAAATGALTENEALFKGIKEAMGFEAMQKMITEMNGAINGIRGFFDVTKEDRKEVVDSINSIYKEIETANEEMGGFWGRLFIIMNRMAQAQQTQGFTP